MDDLIILSTHQVEGATVHVCVRSADVELVKDVDTALTAQPFLRIVRETPAAKASRTSDDLEGVRSPSE